MKTWRSRSSAIAVLLVLALGLAACGGSSKSEGKSDSTGATPGDLTLAMVNENMAHQYGKVWQLMHPTYQALTTREFWEACKEKTAEGLAGWDFGTFKVTDVYSDRRAFAGLGTIDVKAVTLSVPATYLGKTRTLTDTFYWTLVNGEWRGLFDQAAYDAYKAGRCP